MDSGCVLLNIHGRVWMLAVRKIETTNSDHDGDTELENSDDAYPEGTHHLRQREHSQD